MSALKEVFARNIEDDIAPVIYFHQTEPEVAQLEVQEYVFTTRPETQVNQVGGIHEQMVGLLLAMYEAIKKGFNLPSSWISGYFGSGKSLFAKLLGLALDGMILPDGTRMVDALIARNDTPNAEALRGAFEQLFSIVEPMAVIFDIGAAARNNEHVPHTVYRQVLHRLGYSQNDGVAYFELALEEEGRYEEFLRQVEVEYGKPWSEHVDGYLALQVFRTAYKALYPQEDDLLAISTFSLGSLSVHELVSNLSCALERRAPGKTVFVVVDEVSQYIMRDENKMLALQSFVAEIGGRVKPGRSPLWLLVTGQEKLEEEERDSVLFKLKDRFTPPLRVHLDRANVREVVERRLLKKIPGSALESLLTDEHIDAIKLHGYEGSRITRNELIDHYPLLPGHIPLFMDITQSIRNTSVRTQSDSGGVRSVLNNIWSLFNEEPVLLREKPLGTLLTIDMLYDIIGSSVNSDVQLTLHRVFEQHPPESYQSRVAKAIALLEMNAEQTPVTAELLGALLYPKLGAATVQDEVRTALDDLTASNWILYREKHGYAIQNNAAQDWNRQKREITVPASDIIDELRQQQARIAETITQPTMQNVRFPLVCWWGDQHRLSNRTDPTHIVVQFHWATNSQVRHNTDEWISISRQASEVIHWVSGDTSTVASLVREHLRSKRMCKRTEQRGALQPIQQQLLYQELAEADRLLGEIAKELRRAWMDGNIFVNGLVEQPTGNSFDAALRATAEAHLPQIFHAFSQGNIRITDTEFTQLLNRDTAGLPLVFLDDTSALGIAYNDGGKILFRSDGVVPKAVFEYIRSKPFITGEQLLQHFAAPPYGYSRSVIKASVIGLLREERIRLTVENRTEIASVIDPGGRDVFLQDRQFARAEIEAKADDEGLSPRDRTAIRLFFENVVGVTNPDNTSDHLADLTFIHFPPYKDQIASVQTTLAGLGCPVPVEFARLNQLLTDCISERQVEKSLRRLRPVLDELKSGIGRLIEARANLTDTTIQELRALRHVLDYQAEQLKEVAEDAAVAPSVTTVVEQLSSEQPWRAYADAKPAADAVRAHYVTVRESLLERQRQALELAEDQLKMRSDFTALSEEQQFEVLQIVRKPVVDTSADALQPSLVLLQQTSARIREAAARAQQRLDELRSEASGSERINVVSLGVSNTIISNKDELEAVLERIRKRCLRELDAGVRVRFEE